MLDAGVVGDQVHEHADTPPARLGDEPVDVGQGPEGRVHRREVGHVVTPVGVG